MYTVLTHNPDGTICLTGLFRSYSKAAEYAAKLGDESYVYTIESR